MIFYGLVTMMPILKINESKLSFTPNFLHFVHPQLLIELALKASMVGATGPKCEF